MRRIVFYIVIVLFFSCKQTEKKITNKDHVDRPNVLFISVDDLRPELGCYGNELIKTPNIDRLAAEATVFNNAYCQVPVCGASRASILTGLLPNSNRFLSYDTRMDQDAPEALILPQHFKNNGYYTLNYGKVTHFPDDNEEAWSEDPIRLDWTKLADGTWSTEGWRDYVSPENLKIAGNHPNNAGKSYEKAIVHDTAYVDGKNMKMAIAKLQELKEMEQPFFFALGILKPHLPFNAPQKYWDLYNENEIELASNHLPPKNVPEEGITNYPELRAYAKVPAEGPIPDSLAHKLVHGYYASVSYVDALIGDLMKQMEDLGLDKNTIIVLWSDHGWFLGEHGFWCKHSLYELACRVPLIIKEPGESQMKKVKTMVELVDLYPTLCDLAELDKPDHLQGKSFAPAFQSKEYVHKDFTYSRYKSGESIKNNQLRYTAYFNEENKMKSEMLYDLKKDPGENVNVGGDGSYSLEKSMLLSRLDSLRN